MRHFPLLICAAALAGCGTDNHSVVQASDNGRYQLHLGHDATLYRLDTRTGEVVRVNAASHPGGADGPQGTVVLGAAPTAPAR